jgi:hypothetical protein
MQHSAPFGQGGQKGPLENRYCRKTKRRNKGNQELDKLNHLAAGEEGNFLD